MSHLHPPGRDFSHVDGDDGGGHCDDQQRQRGHCDVEGVLVHCVDGGSVLSVEGGEGGAVTRDVAQGVHVGDDVILETG